MSRSAISMNMTVTVRLGVKILAVFIQLFLRQAKAAVTDREENYYEVNSFVGETSVLQCQAAAHTHVLWFYQTNSKTWKLVVDGGEITNDYAARFFIGIEGSHVLVINNTSAADEGLYRCIADGGFGQRSYVRLALRDSKFTSASQSFTVTQKGETNYTAPLTIRASRGQSVSLPCRVSDDKNVLWRLHDSKTVIVTDNRFAEQFKSRFSLGESAETYHHLNISDCREADTGVYECIENNGRGRSHFVLLIISGEGPEKTFDESLSNGLLDSPIFVVIVTIIAVVAIVSFVVTVVACLKRKKCAVALCRRTYGRKAKEQRERLLDSTNAPKRESSRE